MKLTKPLQIGGALIALYLGVAYWTGFGNGVKNLSAGGVSLVKAFQGR